MLFAATDDAWLESVFTFRFNSISRIVEYSARLTRSHGLSIGLDCFSPTLAGMVGQDLSALNKGCDWIKLMTYPRVFGPAGLPFELRALANWLRRQCNIRETEATKIVNEASGLSPSMNGLPSEAIGHEI